MTYAGTLKSRRGFLRAGAASGAALALGLPKAFAAETDPYAGFRMGVQSYTFRAFKFEEALGFIRDLGLKHVELYPGHLNHKTATGAALADARKKLAEHGITADAYGVEGFSKDEKAARAVFEFAKSMELRCISADPKPDSFDLLDKLVEEYKIPVAIHNHGPKHHWGKPEVILAAVKDHHPLIGLCCDSGHFLRANVDPVEAIKILKGRVFGFHVKDFVDEETEKEAGDGRLDIAALLKEAKAQEFGLKHGGACSIEYELNEKDPMAGVERGLFNIRAAIATIK